MFEHFLTLFAKGGRVPALSDRLKERLINHSWMGNVRELRNVAERYVLLGELDFDEEELIDIDEDNIKDKSLDKKNIGDFSIDLKTIEKHVELKIINMLEKQGMSKSDIAKTLGISRSTLWYKINNSYEK